MKNIYFLLILLSIVIFTSFTEKNDGLHLFILSGQSNMELLKPEESFLPILESKFGKNNIIVAKYALGTQPIRKWHRDWKPSKGDNSKAEPYLYDSLMKKVYPAIKNKKIATITFIWMQGERDAKKSRGEVYERSLIGLYNQLCTDLERTDVNFIIGRLSDFGISNKTHPHWSMIRDIQVKVAKSNPRFGWINTDDLNDGFTRKRKVIQNDIHMSADGYKIMGERFAYKAIELIESNK
jgi:hypothetical protein